MRKDRRRGVGSSGDTRENGEMKKQTEYQCGEGERRGLWESLKEKWASLEEKKRLGFPSHHCPS